jgi:acyl dehydratase
MTKEYRPRGLYFEEFKPDTEVVTAGRTITEADIVSFAGLSGDYTTIHTDAEYAKSTPFGERIAHGMLGLSVATGLATQFGLIEGTVIAFTGLNWKFKGPIKIGDTIHATVKVKQTKAMSAAGGGFVIFDVQVNNQRGETVQQGEWSMLVKSKE